MKPLNLVPIKPSINFLIRRQYFFVFSVILLLSSGFFYLFNGLNLGIDFKGGIMLEVRVSSSTNISQMRQGLSNLNLGEIKIQQFGADTDFLIRIQKQEGGEKAQQSAINLVKRTLPNDIKYRRTEFVGPKVSKELYRDGILAVIFAIIGILAYIWFRFEWQFGLGAIIALTHDVITTIGVYALTDLTLDVYVPSLQVWISLPRCDQPNMESHVW